MRMYLNALDNQVVPDLEITSLNYLPDNVPLNAKFTLNQNETVCELQVHVKHKLNFSLRWTKITSKLFSLLQAKTQTSP